MKVAIVGAGICGLYLGWKLAERGEEVTVFEKKEKIGKEVCSGLVSERILKFIPESKKLIQGDELRSSSRFASARVNEIDYCLINFSKRTLKIQFSGKFFVMNHFELDNLVASLAEQAGAKILLKYNVTRKEFVTFQGEFDMIIGCDGANSIVRKNLGLPNPIFRLGIRGFIRKKDHSDPEGEPSVPYRAGFVETWPVKEGFIWKIPRGKETEYGIISDPKGAKLLFDGFLEKNNFYLERVNSGVIPQGLIVPKNQKITLCGDAMGLTKPWSGGGVIWSLIAADILLKNFPDFLKYQKEIKKFFLSKIIFSKMAKISVYFFGFNFPCILPKEIRIEGDFLI